MASGTIPIPSDVPTKYLGYFGSTNATRNASITIPRGEFYILIMASANADKNLLAIVACSSSGVTSCDAIKQGSSLTIATSTDTVTVSVPNNQNTIRVIAIPVNPNTAIPTMTVS